VYTLRLSDFRGKALLLLERVGRPSRNLVSASQWGISQTPFVSNANDLALSTNKIAKPISFEDDTSIIISNISFVSNETINWFSGDLLTLNYGKMTLLKIFNKEP
jgi:hypothetical protein